MCISGDDVAGALKHPFSQNLQGGLLGPLRVEKLIASVYKVHEIRAMAALLCWREREGLSSADAGASVGDAGLVPGFV
jgi:hypothetical protein